MEVNCAYMSIVTICLKLLFSLLLLSDPFPDVFGGVEFVKRDDVISPFEIPSCRKREK